MHRNITEQGLELVKSFEGFRATPYYCSGNVLTIGFGHAVRQGETFMEITQEEGEKLLKDDVGTAERAVLRLTKVPLEDNQFDALCSWVFNVGSGAMQRSGLRQKLNRGEYNEVPTELKKWVYAGGKKIKGLMWRREAEAILFEFM